MIFRDRNKLLRLMFECPKVDVEFRQAVNTSILEQTTLPVEESSALATSIVVTIGALAAATESGFIKPITVFVGNNDYGVLFDPKTPENINN